MNDLRDNTENLNDLNVYKNTSAFNNQDDSLHGNITENDDLNKSTDIDNINKFVTVSYKKQNKRTVP